MAAPAMARTKIGEPAPRFSVRLLDGTAVDAAALAGQVVLVNRWATWCVPCRQELPAIDAYYRLHARDGLRVFAVTIDDTASRTQLKRVSDALSFPLARDVRGGFPVMTGVPTNYVVDRHGIVRYARAAAFDAATLDAVVGPLLAERATAR
jgi:peroxiredoxin